MTRRLGHRRTLALHLVLWVVPLAAVIWWASKQPSPHLPTGGGPLMILGGAVALYAVATLLRAERWERILREAAIPAERADVYPLVLIGYAGNNVLPARGGEVLRTYLLSQATGASKRSVLGTIVAERVLDAAALAILVLALAYDVLQKVEFPSGGTLVIALCGFVLVCAVIAAVAYRMRGRLGRVLRAVAPVVTSTRALLSRHGIRLLALSLLIWMVEAGVYIATALAVHIHLGFTGGLAVVAFANAAALIPAAPGYVGTFDGAVIFAAKTVDNIGGAAVTGYLVLLRFVLFIPITVVGFALLLVRYGGLSRLRAARAAEVSA